jgi:hypothetical protein
MPLAPHPQGLATYGRIATMTLKQFRSTLAQNAPPDGIAPPLAAMWWAAKGDWDKAHALVMDDSGGDAAWVHAYLHRVEGDLPNARYWYRQAARPPATVTLDHEWEQIAAALL